MPFSQAKYHESAPSAGHAAPSVVAAVVIIPNAIIRAAVAACGRYRPVRAARAKRLPIAAYAAVSGGLHGALAHAWGGYLLACRSIPSSPASGLPKPNRLHELLEGRVGAVRFPEAYEGCQFGVGDAAIAGRDV